MEKVQLQDLVDLIQTALKKLAKCKYLYIGDTVDKGLGVFSSRAYRPGDIIICDNDGDYRNSRFTRASLEALGVDIARLGFQIANDEFLLPNINIDDFTNHSCCPNSGLRLTDLGYDVIALRHIKAGDEITYDYSTYMFDDIDSFECHCGEETCRRLVLGFRSLSKEQREFYIANEVVSPLLADQPASEAMGLSHVNAAGLKDVGPHRYGNLTMPDGAED